MNTYHSRQLTVDQSQRIDAISRFIFEIAQGNFNFDIPQSEMEDELDAIIVGIRMLKEELKGSTVSRNYLESIYKGVVDILFVLDEHRIVQECNTAAISFLGIPKAKVIGQPFSRFVEYPMEASPKQKSEWEAGQVANIELYFKRGGVLIPTMASVSQLVTTGNQKSGMLVVAKEISAQKQAEEDLRAAKEYAEAANVAKSNFLANMSHEIRTPLNSILGLTEIMMRENTNESQREYLRIIRQSGNNLSRLINDILDFSKIESGKLTLEEVPIDFTEVVNSAIQPYRFLAEEKGLAFDCTFDGAIPRQLKGDPTRISQIITNLVSNAIKFTSRGDISVRFSLFSNLADSVIIRGKVADTGMGIPVDKEQLIFQNFTQADESVTRKFGGTGLGLSIVKSLLQLMDGDIAVQSPADQATGQGSIFTFSLNLKRTLEKAPTHSNTGDGLAFPKPMTVLVVDDNPINVLVARKMLLNLHATVVTAESGAEAIELVKTRSFDMILMDIQMPDLDGYQTTSAMRGLGYNGPIVALSASAFVEDVRKSLAAGMNGHVQKPFTQQLLFDAIMKYFGNP